MSWPPCFHREQQLHRTGFQPPGPCGGCARPMSRTEAGPCLSEGKRETRSGSYWSCRAGGGSRCDSVLPHRGTGAGEPAEHGTGGETRASRIAFEEHAAHHLAAGMETRDLRTVLG